MEIRTYQPVDEQAVVTLWDRCGLLRPWNDPHKARTLLREAEKILLERGCPKINLQIRRDNLAAIGFYESAGFSEDEVVSFGKRLIPDD